MSNYPDDLGLPTVESQPDTAVLDTLSALLGKEPTDERLLDVFVSLAATYQSSEEDIPAHLRRIATYVKVLGRAMKLPDDKVRLYTYASAFHDVGMGEVDSAILLKRGALTPEEVARVQEHARDGYKLLVGGGNPFMDAAALIALRHHEYWDGGGYPDGVSGESIPLAARIVAVADVYDALTTRKPWKEPYPPHVARDIVESLAGNHFDPKVVEAFVRSFDVLNSMGRTLQEEGGGQASEGWSRTGMTQFMKTPAPDSFQFSQRDTTRNNVFQTRDYFSCPYCKAMHKREVEACTEHRVPVRRVHKLSGHLLKEKYLLKSAAGAGGMGAVYEAVHLLTQRRLAIKMLDPVMAKNDADMKRFFEEARVFATVGHPNLVEILDVDRTQDKDAIPFMVMEFLEGEDLADALYRIGKLTEATAAVVGIEILMTLAAVHAKGIVHRDLKPENIYLTNDCTRLKLLDFGVSLHKQPEGSNRPRLTEEGAFVGTPEYMSPEQALGRDDLDHRSDLFTVGALLYEMVTGKRAFEGYNAMATMMAVANVRYEPVKDRCPDISAEMLDAIQHALQENPRDRFRSALEFAGALEPIARQHADWRPGFIAGIAPPPVKEPST